MASKVVWFGSALVALLLLQCAWECHGAACKPTTWGKNIKYLYRGEFVSRRCNKGCFIGDKHPDQTYTTKWDGHGKAYWNGACYMSVKEGGGYNNWCRITTLGSVAPYPETVRFETNGNCVVDCVKEDVPSMKCCASSDSQECYANLKG